MGSPGSGMAGGGSRCRSRALLLLPFLLLAPAVSTDLLRESRAVPRRSFV